MPNLPDNRKDWPHMQITLFGLKTTLYARPETPVNRAVLKNGTIVEFTHLMLDGVPAWDIDIHSDTGAVTFLNVFSRKKRTIRSSSSIKGFLLPDEYLRDALPETEYVQ
jgi:hypothetical protein